MPLLLLDVALEFAEDRSELGLDRVVVGCQLLQILKEFVLLARELVKLLLQGLELLVELGCTVGLGLLFHLKLLDDCLCNLQGVYLLLHHSVKIQVADELLLQGGTRAPLGSPS